MKEFAQFVERLERGRLRHWTFLFFGAWVLFLILVPVATEAQMMCNSSLTPTPPPAMNFNVSNQTFGNTPPQNPFQQFTLGMNGCDGVAGGFNESGGNGQSGTARRRAHVHEQRRHHHRRLLFWSFR